MSEFILTLAAVSKDGLLILRVLISSIVHKLATLINFEYIFFSCGDLHFLLCYATFLMLTTQNKSNLSVMVSKIFYIVFLWYHKHQSA